MRHFPSLGMAALVASGPRWRAPSCRIVKPAPPCAKIISVDTSPPHAVIMSWGNAMTSDLSAPDDLLRRAASGDVEAVAELFSHYRDRLKRMVLLRLDRRLQGKIDASDVLQEAYLDLARRAGEIGSQPTMPFFL